MNVFGAIDIGSNAARLLISEVYDNDGTPYFKKRSLVRVPLRLGQEVFELGTIPPKKVEAIVKSMKAYKELLEINEAVAYKAVATSAMRDADNGAQIVECVKVETGIEIEIITGQLEAKLLYATHYEELLNRGKSYLYLDVGGGSTEISLFEKGILKTTRSFNIGTLRLMNEQVSDMQWKEMKRWIDIHTKHLENLTAIGSGGNINKLYKLNGSRVDKRISYSELISVYDRLKGYSFLERVVELGMRGDRADVILPATKIFTKVMKWARIEEVYVPKFGLSDGIVRMLAQEFRADPVTLS